MKSNTLKAGLFLAVLSFNAPVFTQNLMATDLEKETSLKLIPRDADFYYSSLRMREELEKLLASKPMVELRNTPFIQRVITKLKDEWNQGSGQISQAKPYLENPIVQSVLGLVGDMASQEVFVFGDANFSRFAVEISKFQHSMLENGGGSGNPEALMQWLMELEPKDLDFSIPTAVMGFKVKDKEGALTLLDQLEGITRFAIAAVPNLGPLGQSLRRVEDSRGTRLALRLAGEMIPWDTVPGAGDPERDRVVAKLQQLLKDRQFAITIGQLDGYVVIAMSEKADVISKLGQADSLLSHPYLQPLKARSSELITGIAYASDKLADSNYKANLRHYFSNLYLQTTPAIEQLFDGDIPDFLDSLEDDATWLDDQIAALVPEFKGQLGFSFSNATGSEGYLYNHTVMKDFVINKKLDILQHVNGKPLAMLAFRQSSPPEYLAFARRLLQKARGYLVAMKDSDVFEDEEHKKHIELALKKGYPLVVEYLNILEKKLIPGMKDGQKALVLTQGNLESKQYIPEMPMSDVPLPLPEFGAIAGVSNRELVIEGYVDFFNLLDDVVELVQEIAPNAVPEDYSIPRPKQVSFPGGEKYHYPIPDDCPVPKSMAPQMVFKDQWMITTYSDKLTEKLAANVALDPSLRKLIDDNKPLGAASYIDLGGIVRFVTPWIRYSLLQQNDDLNEMLVPEDGPFPGLSGKDVLQIWTALGKLGVITSATEGLSGGGTVSHWSFTGN